MAVEVRLFNPLITATAGWSAAVEERSKRLLSYQVGTEEGGGRPVRISTLFVRRDLDPVNTARYLMVLPPLQAIGELARLLSGCTIDDTPCPAPGAIARAALAYAGRAVDIDAIHPERRFVLSILAALAGLFHRLGGSS